MSQVRSTTASLVRSAFSRRGLRAAVLAGVAAASLGTAGIASAATHAGPAAASHHIRPDGWVPVEQCLNWSGTVKFFPALTKTSKSVNAVLTATLSNCELDGTQQSFSGTAFGTLTGTATKSGATLTGNVAVTWPSDAGLDPTISSISLSTSNGVYSFVGQNTAGAFTGEELWGSYQKTGLTAISGGSSETILGSAPFAAMENLG